MNRISDFNNASICFLIALFFMLGLNMIFPSQYMVIQFLLMLSCASLGIIFLFKMKSINIPFFISICVFISYSFLSLCFGYFLGFKFDLAILNIYCLRPVLIFIIASYFTSNDRIYALIKILILLSFFLLVIDMINMLAILGFLPSSFNFSNSLFGASDDFMVLRLGNQATLTYIVPFIIFLNLTLKSISSYYKTLLRICFVLGVIESLLSGRRILQIVTLISIFFSFIYLLIINNEDKINKKYINKQLFKTVFIIVIIIIILLIFQKQLGLESIFETIWKTILNAFDSDDRSFNIKSNQMLAMLDTWEKYPLFGQGLSSYCLDFIRSTDTPWSYEMAYNALLMQTGLIGITSFFMMIFHILKTLYTYYKKFNSYVELGILIGFIMFLISAATNPMLTSIWAWLITLCFYNHSILCLRKIK